MAAALPPVTPGADLIAVRLPGSSLTRFCQSPLPLAAGDWVALASPWGDEAALVVAPPGRLEAGPIEKLWPAVTRRLVPAEIERAAAGAERALGQLASFSRLAAEELPGVTLTGLRYTLAGTAICSYQTGEEPDEAALRTRLSELLGEAVELERERAGSPVVGGLGRLRSAPLDLAALTDARLRQLGTFPALGSPVRFPGGQGRLVGVSLRHREARLRLADGEERVVPLAEIQLA